jgi:putative toxin-antitoxin system antitoxin component (TIGR02293 family)
MSTATTISKPALSIEALLGGRRVFRLKQRTALDWDLVIRHGLSSAAVDSLAKTIRVTQSELAVALDIPVRTLARRKKEGTLNGEESAKLVRLLPAV